MDPQFTYKYEIIRIVYVSNASEDSTLETIYDIERCSIKNNKAAGITGFLTYKENTFMQFLEGPEPSLQRLLVKIKKDSRHSNMDILRKCNIRQRQFNDWHMKYIPIESVKMKNDMLYNKLFEQGGMDKHTLDLALESRAIITAFKEANYYR